MAEVGYWEGSQAVPARPYGNIRFVARSLRSEECTVGSVQEHYG